MAIPGYPEPGQWNYNIPDIPSPTYGTPVSTQPTGIPNPPASAAQSPTAPKPITPTSYRGARAAPRVEPPDLWQQTPSSYTGQTGPIYNMYDPYTYENANQFQNANRYLSSW